MVTAVVGANWGDEGKGKITDMLAQKADIVIRYQGGANAGHTIKNEYGKFALHTLPSGAFSKGVVNVIGNGVALNVRQVLKEIREITEKGVPAPNLLISDRAQIVMSSLIPSRKRVSPESPSARPAPASLRSSPTSSRRPASRSASWPIWTRSGRRWRGSSCRRISF